MFDEVIQKVAGKRAARRVSWLGVSTVAQALLAIGVVWLHRGAAVQAKPEPVVEVTFVKGGPRPAMPPPPRPPPAARKKAPREPPREPPSIPALIQPKEVLAEADLAPHDPDEAHAPDDPDRTEGVVGGAVGGDTTGAAAQQPQEFDAASMARPVFVSGPDLAYTRRAFEREVEGLMIVKCVVTAEGTVRACKVARGLPYMDQAIVDALERRRYRPAMRDGKPVEVNYEFRINLRLPR